MSVVPSVDRVVLRGITKRFGTVLANDHVDLDVQAGEIHALVGENGAGKTTLMKILFGLYTPDEGSIAVDGRPVVLANPNAAIALGIGMVHQHFMLLESLTVAENIVLGHEPTTRGMLDRGAAVALARDLSLRYGLKVDPLARVRSLSVGIRQRVEILKALARGVRVLILDEPTAVLTPQETGDLFRTIRNLAAEGLSVIFITHKLREVVEISDRVTVMRMGRKRATVTNRPVGAHDAPPRARIPDLARMMIGRDTLPTLQRDGARPGREVLTVRALTATDDRGADALRGITLAVRAGEIVGIAGVEGNGQSELIETLTGLRRVESGEILLDGISIRDRSPRAIREAGLGHIAEDRLKYGVATRASIQDNLIMSRQHGAPLVMRGILLPGRVQAFARDLIRRFDIRTGSPALPAASLSGGNMQKVVVAREISGDPRLLIAAQPTRGVDIGAIESIHRTLLESRDRGTAILLISAELTEILALSDRILVIYEGQIVGSFDRTVTDSPEITEEELGLYMLGARRMAGASS